MCFLVVIMCLRHTTADENNDHCRCEERQRRSNLLHRYWRLPRFVSNDIINLFLRKEIRNLRHES